MKLKYETGIATLIQFATLSLLNIATGANSVVTTCRTGHGDDCISNLLVSMIFFLLVTIWFAAVWMLGYMAQERRSRRLAQLLICAELLIALIALFNAKHHTDFLGLFTSVVDLGLAIWVIVLAVRLIRVSSGQVTVSGRSAGQRPRQRRKPMSKAP